MGESLSSVANLYSTRASTLTVAVLLTAVVTGGIQCIEAPLAPVAPASTIELSIPLVDRTRSGEDLVEKGGALRIGSDGGFVYEANETFTPIALPTITVTPRPSSQQVSVGRFSIGALPPVSQTLQPLPQGTYTPFIPSGSVTVPASSLPQFSNFDYVAISSGTLSLQITNNYPFTIELPDTLLLKNDSSSPLDTNSVAAFFFADSIAQGQSRTATSNLSGKLLRSGLRIAPFRLNNRQSSGSVTIDANSGISFQFSSATLTADSASAEIPSQTVVPIDSAEIEIDDSVSITSATFKGGTLTTRIVNNLGVTVGVFLRFADFVNKQTGAPFEINRSIDPATTFIQTINASDYRISMSPQQLGTRLRYTVGINTISSTNKVTIRASDFIRAELIPGGGPFGVESVTGRIKPTYVNINTGASGVYDLGEAQKKFSGQFKFDSIRIALKLPITGSFVTDYDFYLVAQNRRVTPNVIDSIRMPVNSVLGRRRIKPALIGPPPELVLDKSSNFDDFLGRFFPNLPDTFIVRGYVLLNPPEVFPTDEGIQSIWDTTKIYPSVGLTFPSRLGLAGGVVTDTIDLGNSAKFPKDFVNSLKSGTMFLEITNGLGIQLSFRSFLINTAGARRDTILRIPIDTSRTILAAQVDGAGYVSSPRTSAFSVTLTGNDLAKFDLANIMGIRLDIETSGGGNTPIKLRSTDFLQIKASMNVQYTVNKPK